MKFPHLEILTPASVLPLSVFEVQTYLRTEGDFEYEILLPKQPVLSVSEVRVINADDSINIVDDSRYFLSSGNEKLICDTIFSGKRIEIDFFAGISETAEAAPDFIKQALLNHIAFMYERKTASPNIPELAKYLYNFHRRVRF